MTFNKMYLKEMIRHPIQYIGYLYNKYKCGPFRVFRRMSCWMPDEETRKEIIKNGWK